MGADAHDENGPDELGQEMGSIGFPKVQQAEDVEYDHEQDAEQDRKQHGRGRKSFHIPNVTPPPADGGMPILPGSGCSSPSSGRRITRASRAMPPESKAARPGLIRNPFAWIRRTAGD